MKTWTMALAGALALALVVDTAMAQRPGGRRPQGERPGPPPEGRGPRGDFRPPRFPLMVALDANEDGELSAEEINNAVAALKKLDKDNDGKLSREELRPEFGPGGPEGRAGQGRGGQGRGGPGDIVQRMMGFDENGDGKVSKEEMPEQMRERMFGRADANGDGFIDKKEMEAIAERFRQGGGGRGEGRGGEGGRRGGGGRGEGRGGEGGRRGGGGDRPQRPPSG